MKAKGAATKGAAGGSGGSGRSLETYRRKRDPGKTPEPMGAGRTAKESGMRFVIQEHHARSLHWDLRLERNGVLASWALPKGLPDTPDQNHLAVHTEDHPLEYATFEGDIPQGEYGAGRMTIWDSGRYSTEKWTETEVKFTLHGGRASGDFVLFQTKDRNWMIHRHGQSVRTDAMPTSLKPMLATPGTLPASSTGWAFEIKWDGIRAILFVEGGRVRAQSRNDLDVTGSFPELAEIGKFLGMEARILDGEIVALGQDGRPSFAALQHRMHVTNHREALRRSANDPATFVAFDLLYADGRLLVDSPYDERRQRLESLGLNGPSFITTESFRDVDGQDILNAAVQNGLEGVVVKRRDGPYRPGRRSTDWLKVKSFRTQEAVIGGWTEGQGERAGSLGALLLGLPGAEGTLRYIGKVGTGFDAQSRRELLEEMGPLAVATSPFDTKLPATDASRAHFVEPRLVGEVEFGEWTRAGRLRHPVWRGLRPDKRPSDVELESA